MSSLRCALLRCALLRVSPASSSRITVRSMSSASSSRFDRAAKLSDESVMEHLVCPISKYPLRYAVERGSVVCDEINVEYPIWQGVPILVPSEGRIINSSDHQ